MYFGDDTTQGTTLENTIQRIFRYRLPGEVCLHYLPGTNKVHLGYEVVSAIVYSYECTFARSSVIFHRKGSDDDRTTPAE